MFLRTSTDFQAVKRILHTAACQKSIVYFADSFPSIHKNLNTSWKRFAAVTDKSYSSPLIKPSPKNRNNKSQVVFVPEIVDKDINNNNNKMPPKKLKLASIMKNLSNSEENVSVSETKTMENVSPKKAKLNLGNLRVKTSEKKDAEESEPAKTSTKRLLKAVVDMEMMKDELKQLEDPPTTKEDKILSANRLGFEFFNVESITLAKNLLGKILVRKLENGTILKGKIVETESYLGGEDKASQTYQHKVTPRNLPMYMSPGTIYVYLTYGMYHCFNISSAGEGSVVLIRALSPIEGMDQMAELRNSKPTKNSKPRSVRSFKDYELSNGPSKFCMAFSLNRDHTKYSLCSWKGMWIEDNDDSEKNFKIVECSRIGIDRAGIEWASKPMRYYIMGDKSVSKIDKKAESKMSDD